MALGRISTFGVAVGALVLSACSQDPEELDLCKNNVGTLENLNSIIQVTRSAFAKQEDEGSKTSVLLLDEIISINQDFIDLVNLKEVSNRDLVERVKDTREFVLELTGALGPDFPKKFFLVCSD